MKRLLILIPLLLPLGGCSVYMAAAVADMLAPKSVAAMREAARTYCAAVGSAEQQATALALADLTGECKAIARVRAIVTATQAICNNVDRLTATQMVTYTKNLSAQWKKAQIAVEAGC